MAKLEEYQAFITIVDSGSLAKAAKALHISPPAMSKKLAVLEDRLGLQLIDRTTRSLSPTDEGKMLYREFKPILAAVENLETKLQDSKDETVGKLAINCPAALINSQFITVINQFSDAYPNIKLDLQVSNEIEDLIEGKIDFTFRIGKLKDSRLHVIPLQETQPVFCASPNYLNKHGQLTHIGELQNHKIIIPTYLNISERLRQLFPGQGPLNLDLFDTTNDVQALYKRVRLGAGIAMMLDIVVKEDLESGNLVQLFSQIAFPTQPIVMLFHKDRYQPRKMETFKEFIKANWKPAVS